MYQVDGVEKTNRGIKLKANYQLCIKVLGEIKVKYRKHLPLDLHCNCCRVTRI